MRRPVVTSLLILVLLLAVAAAAAGLGGAATPPQAQAGPATAATHWCNFVLAGKNATADGSVLMGYNNDWSANNYVYLQAVPGDATHYQYVQAADEGRRARGRHQRCTSSAPCTASRTDLDSAVLAADPVREEGLRRRDLGPHPPAVHHRAAGDHPARPDGRRPGSAPARPAASPSAIPTQVWLFELLGGHHWVAQRVPDNAFLAHPNMVTVRQVDLSRHRQLPRLGRPPVVRPEHRPLQPVRRPLRRRLGLRRPRRAAVLLQHEPPLGRLQHGRSVSRAHARRCRTRRAPCTWCPTTRSRGRTSQTICRYHYEGTAIDQTQDYTLMSPHAQTNRPICYSTTDYSAVWQLRSWKPDDIGGVMWVAPCRPCSSAYVPFYDSITSVPTAWTEQDRVQRLPHRRRQPGQERAPSAASSATSTTSRSCRAPTARSRPSARTPRRAPSRRPPA